MKKSFLLMFILSSFLFASKLDDLPSGVKFLPMAIIKKINEDDQFVKQPSFRNLIDALQELEFFQAIKADPKECFQNIYKKFSNLLSDLNPAGGLERISYERNFLKGIGFEKEASEIDEARKKERLEALKFHAQSRLQDSTTSFFFPSGEINEEYLLQYVPKRSLNSYVGGMSQDMQDLLAILKGDERYKKLCVEKPNGILVYGPPGTGKSMGVEAMAKEIGAAFIYKSGAEFIEKHVGVGAKRIRELVDEAIEIAKNIKSKKIKNFKHVIVCIDELDALGGQRGSDSNSREDNKAITQLMTILDGINFDGKEFITFVAITNREDILDSALTRSGRFDWKIYKPLPDFKMRYRLIKYYLFDYTARPLGDIEQSFIEDLSFKTAGLNCADIRSIVNQAARIAARRKDDNKITTQDLLDAFDIVKVYSELDDYKSMINFKDCIGGVSQELLDIKSICLNQGFYFNIKNPSVVLLYGPSGSGKAHSIKALANEVNAAFVYKQGSTIFKYKDDSSGIGELLTKVKGIAQKIKNEEIQEFDRVFLFIDEVSAAFSKNSGSYDVGILLEKLNHLIKSFETINFEGKDLVTLVLSFSSDSEYLINALDTYDKVNWKIRFQLPDNNKKIELAWNYLSSFENSIDKSLIQEIFKRLSDTKFNCRDVKNLVEKSALFAAREGVAISADHLNAALDFVKPSSDENPLVS